jgi:restriction system protein
MASSSILAAANGLEPLQTLVQGLTSVFVLATIGVIGLTVFVALLRFGVPVAVALLSGGTRPISVASDPFSAATEASAPAPVRTSDIATKLRSIDWFQFEKLMEIVFRKQGYLVDRRGGANPDGGIDLVLMKESEKIAVQCKHWRNRDVGVPKIRELVGAMADTKISKGILVTISDYTDEAKAFGDRNGVEIVNHSALTRLLDSVDASYDPEIQQLLNDRRKVCPKCERLMVLRTARKGENVGSQFWGCSGFPACRHRERY